MPVFKYPLEIEANSKQEADQIAKMFGNMYQHATNKELIKTAKKVNAEPKAKVKKMMQFSPML